MEFTYFIGIDVSKRELDFAVMHGKSLLFHKEIENKPETIKVFIKELGALPSFDGYSGDADPSSGNGDPLKVVVF